MASPRKITITADTGDLVRKLDEATETWWRLIIARRPVVGRLRYAVYRVGRWWRRRG